MEFDEYEYLEITVENPELGKSKDKLSRGDIMLKSEDKSEIPSSKHDKDYDDLGSSRRSRSEKESYDHAKERRSRHDSSSRDKERDEKDKDRSFREPRNVEERVKEKYRDKDRVRGRERNGEKDNDMERDGKRERKEREYTRDKEGEGERERMRRGRSHLERHHDERGRETSRYRDSTDKVHKEGRKDRDHESGRHKEKKEEPDPERDQRTIFAYQISLKADEKDILKFFSRAGKVRDIQLIKDRNTGRSKGFGYVEFYDVMSVPMAIALCGQPLLGQPVMIKPSEAEKNLVQPTPAVPRGGNPLNPYSGEARKLYVGNLPFTIKEGQLRQVFEPFGDVELVQMPVDPGTGNCKGFAFVQFARLEDAKAAQNLNGQLEIAGKVIKVAAITDEAGKHDVGGNNIDLDDDDGSGLSLNPQSRALLMKKLERSETASSTNVLVENYPPMPAAPVLGQTSVTVVPGSEAMGVSVPSLTGPMAINTIGMPSECLLLNNMFDPNTEVEPDFDLDIKEDVEDECSRFGTLKHIHVDKNSAGLVYLRFDNTESAMAAQRALHGRWFAGKMVTATFMLPQTYEAKFPASS